MSGKQHKRLRKNDSVIDTTEIELKQSSVQSKAAGTDFYGSLADNYFDKWKTHQNLTRKTSGSNNLHSENKKRSLIDMQLERYNSKINNKYNEKSQERSQNSTRRANRQSARSKGDRKRRLRRNRDEDDESEVDEKDFEDYGKEDEQASPDEDEGGSSQDKFEREFINDRNEDFEEGVELKTKKQAKLHSSEEEYYTKSQKSEGSEDQCPEDDSEIYDTLKLAQGQKEGGFKLDSKSGRYYLKEGFSLPEDIYANLFEHQKQGVAWLNDLFIAEKGGVLGDDMGLGKTIQICSYLKGLFDSDQIKKVLIVVPATMKSYWLNELNKWCYGAPNIMAFEDKKKSDREQQIRALKKKGGVLITSYGMVTSERLNLSEMRYDVLVVDEGHKAKNINTELRKNLVALRVKGHRLILSGTPLQNNLAELWSVFDFVQPKIFGSYSTFTRNYADVIEKGLLKDASSYEKSKATELSQKLRKMYESHFLRRTKDSVFQVVSAETIGRPLRQNELPLKTDLVVWIPLSQTQRKIYQFILQNQNLQELIEEREIQNAFFILSYIKKLCLHPYLLAAASVKKRKQIGLVGINEELEMIEELQRNQLNQVNQGIKTRHASAVAKKKQRQQLKALDAHKDSSSKHTDDESKPKAVVLPVEPDDEWLQNKNKAAKKFEKLDDSAKSALLEEQKLQESEKLKEIDCKKAEVQKLYQTFGLDEIFKDIEGMYKTKDFQSMIELSTKCQFLFSLIKDLKQNGHRLLIFSMSKKMLNLIEEILSVQENSEAYKYVRIDGDTEIASREAICTQFNNDPSIFCCLLTTRVGGFGLNLTGANRALILDPDWNPANDNQAIDRICRIGQKRDVIVYRLVTMGGIEEKIYRRQIFKKGINLQTIDTATGTDDPQTFHKYFNDSDLFELFKFDYDNFDTKCETMEMLLERDGFHVEKTPTIDKHLAFLRQMPVVKGLSLNSNLYSKVDDQKSAEVLSQPADVEPKSPSTSEDCTTSSKAPKEKKRLQKNQLIQSPQQREERLQTQNCQEANPSSSNFSYILNQRRLQRMLPSQQTDKSSQDKAESQVASTLSELDRFAFNKRDSRRDFIRL